MANLRGGTLIGGSVAITYKILLSSILTIDGSGSGIDADLLDGHHADYFSPVTHLHDDRYVKKSGDILTGALNFNIRSGCDDPIVIDMTGVNGDWARGIAYHVDGNQVAGLGAFGNNGATSYAFIGVGRYPYTKESSLVVYENNITYRNNKVWHEGNDGSGSGLDADMVDGIQASRIIYGDNDKGTIGINESNTLTKSGFYYPNSTTDTNNTLPEGAHSGIIHYQDPTNDGYFFQIASHFGPDNKLFYRQKSAGHLGEWNRIYHTGNKPTPVEINAINRTGDTDICKLAFRDTGNIGDCSLTVMGPNSGGKPCGSIDTFRGIKISHAAAGSVLIGGIRGESYDDYFTVLTTEHNSSDYNEVLRIGSNGNIIKYKGNRIWHEGNDGSGSGLDADMVDGIQASRIIYGDNENGTITCNDLNTLTKSGFYDIKGGANTPNTNADENWFWVLNLSHSVWGTWGLQIAGANLRNEMYFRNKKGGGGWCRLWNDHNHGSGSGLNADLLDGYHGSSDPTPNTAVIRDGSASISATDAKVNTVTLHGKVRLQYNETTKAIEFAVL